MTTDGPTMTAFQAEVAERFGVLPNLFCTATSAPGLIDELWGFARSAYLDLALPSLFKERLFVQLSRFCEIRYCIVRHVGFLVGLGRPAGDPDATPESVDDVIALLSRPLPDAARLSAALERLTTEGLASSLPEPGTEAEGDLFDALTVIFVEPARSGRAREAVRIAVGDQMFELLAAYLAFVRTAHFWTETHPELAFEPDMVALMEQRPDLREMLLSPADAERVRAGGDLRHVLAELHQIEAALRDSETRFRAFVNATSDVVYRMGPDWSEMRQLDGRGFLADTPAPDENWMEEYILAEDRAMVRAAIDRSIRTKSMFELVHRVMRVDGSPGWTHSRAVPILAADGEIAEWIGAAKDATEARQAREELRDSERRLKLLVAELQHRVRNILTVVRLTFSRTAEDDGTKEDLVNHFLGRLGAMARTQVTLTRHADRTANLENLIRDELLSVGVHVDGGSVTLAGPEVELDHKTAESLAMALHELTTNALKYGALATAGAKLDVRWETNTGEGNARTLRLSWSEQGVPAIAVQPARRGFGRELIEEALPYRLGAETRLEFRGGGVRCDISVPLGSESSEVVS